MTIAYVCDNVYMCVCEFRDEILLRGKNVQPRKNQNFLKKGKIVICRYSTGENLEIF